MSASFFRSYGPLIARFTFGVVIVFWLAIIALEPGPLASSGAFLNLINWRVVFERFTSLPSGVTPVFPVFFLATTFAIGVYFQLAGRRLYRLSYMPSELRSDEADPIAAHFEKILIEMRKTRNEVDELVSRLRHVLGESNLWLRCVIGFVFLHVVIRCSIRGVPRSLETRWFDLVFWSLFGIAFAARDCASSPVDHAVAECAKDASLRRSASPHSGVRPRAGAVQGLVLRRRRLRCARAAHSSAEPGCAKSMLE